MTDMINIAEGFQYAINIFSDANDSSKMRNYVFTSGSIEVLKNLFDAAYSNTTDKSHFLIGPYGKGKSHLALVLLNILFQNKDDSMKNIFLQIKNLDEELFERIEKFYKNNKKLLPVIIQNRRNETLEQSFLLSLNRTLKENDLTSIIPNSFFSNAIDTINMWQKNYKQTFAAFESKIGNTELFISELKKFNKEEYSKFIEIYPTLTSGSAFTPSANSDVVEFYNDVNTKLSSYGYEGIYVIFDEFSKYLEANLSNNISSDLKMLQDFAEAANRSKENQLHLLLITHQSLLNYVDSLSKTQVDNWKAVGNRFNELHLNTSLLQYYELISKVIIHDEKKYTSYLQIHKDEFATINKLWEKTKSFSDLNNKIVEKIFVNTYPLHPSSLYMLPLLSEKVAQNERTIFTFLASTAQRNTLPDFINKHNFLKEEKLNYITPDILYDYFSPLFEQNSYTNDVFKINKKVIAALSKVRIENKELCEKIIKTLGIIQIVDRPDIIIANDETFINIFYSDKKEVLNSLRNLIEKKIIRKSDFSETYDFAEYSQVNIDESIKNKEIEIRNENSVAQILTNFVSNQAFYPVKYNSINSIVRFFRIEFINDKDLNDEKYKESIESNFADGIFYCVLGDDRTSINKIFQKTIVCIFLRNKNDYVKSKVESLAYKFKAIETLISKAEQEKSNDVITIGVLESIKNDCIKGLKQFVDEYLKCELQKADYYIEGKKTNSCDNLSLGEKISTILSEKYKKYPVILNEMINKNQISGQTERACVSLLNQIFNQKEYICNFGFKNTSQENSIIKSVYEKNKIYKYYEGKIFFDPLSNDVKTANEKLYDTFVVIDEFIKKSVDKKQNIIKLYDNLENKIGLRLGIIPLLLGAIFVHYKENIFFIKDGIEYDLNAELLYEINKEPKSYTLSLTNYNKEKSSYIDNLTRLFEKYLDYTKNYVNNLGLLVYGMQRWYSSLPKFTKNMFDNETKNLFKPLSQLKINLNDYLFSYIPENLNTKNDYKKTFIEIEKRVQKEDCLINIKIEEINKKLSYLYNASDEIELKNNISIWYHSLSSKVKNHIVETRYTKLLKAFSEPINSINEFIRHLAIVDTELKIEDWTIETFTSFLKDISECKRNYDLLQNNTNKSESKELFTTVENEYAIKFYDKDGKSVVKTFNFEKQNGSPYKLLKNELRNNMKEYQASLTSEEKCSVLLSLMKELLDYE